ncbi:hypothetical protein J3F83DRAFT_750217 [Trichoderma novae-zelandiae]
MTVTPRLQMRKDLSGPAPCKGLGFYEICGARVIGCWIYWHCEDEQGLESIFRSRGKPPRIRPERTRRSRTEKRRERRGAWGGERAESWREKGTQANVTIASRRAEAPGPASQVGWRI